MVIKNPNVRIGDFLGTIPVMQEIQSLQPETVFKVEKDVQDLAIMAGLRFITEEYRHGYDFTIDLEKAFSLAASHNLHMTQAFYHQLGLGIPNKPVKPKLVFPLGSPDIAMPDYIIAPFALSLPEEQKWQMYKWQALVDQMQDKSFIIIGSVQDNLGLIKGNNVKSLFGYGLSSVGMVLKGSTYGLISNVSGMSHFAYALDVKNYLFTQDQGAWGLNPDAHIINGSKKIWDFSPLVASEFLKIYQ